MPSLRSVSRSEGLGARRWDALIVGSGLASLVAASRLGKAGHRVLVVEEASAKAAFPGLREPFFLGGARDGGVIDGCLRELTLPLIERRRIEEQELALQVVSPDLRLDVGELARTARELVAWDVASPDAATAVVRALAEASEAERKVMLGAPVVRIGRRLARGRPLAPSHVRGLPAEAARPPELLAPILAAGVRALSSLAEALPSPEARARLLGSLLAGGAGFSCDPPWLAGLLRHRAESHHVEFRAVSGELEFVESGGEPGLLNAGGQLWLGRLLVIAAPTTALAASLKTVPDFVDAKRTARRRLAVHFRCTVTALPVGMGPRVVLTPGLTPGLGMDSVGPVMLSLHRGAGSADKVDLVARAVVTDAEAALDDGQTRVWEERIEERVRGLLQFAEKKLVRQKVERPRWDDDDWLEDPPPGQGWPSEIDLRVNGRPPVYRLDRAGIAGLGVEGDLLLGWRGGDAIAGEL
jgi:hypothetical protein